MGRELETDTDELSPGNAHRLILYDAPASPCSRRCRIAMLEKGLDWDTVNVNLALMEQRSAAYLAINPNGLVPTLAHGQRIVFESAAINTYLEDQFPTVRLMPDNARDLARVRMWQASELAMAKIFRPLMYALNGGPIKRITRTEEEAEILARRSTTDPYDLAWEKRVWRLEVLGAEEIRQKLDWLRQWLDVVDTALTDRAFLVGDDFTHADIAVYPRLHMFANVDLEITAGRYPHLRRWMDAIQSRESIAASLPEAARRYAALVTSGKMKKVRDYFYRTEPNDRQPEDDEMIRQFGIELRDKLGVEAQLAAVATRRTLPRPADGKNIEPKTHRAPAGDEPDSLTLYGSGLSPHSYRIELLLRRLGRACRYVDVDIASRENHSRWFRALNPLAEVPVLVADDFKVFDSAAIAEYLCHGQSRDDFVVPATSVDRARHDMWLALESGGHKEFTPLLDASRFAGTGDTRAQLDDERRRLLVHRALQRLEPVDASLAETPFLLGNAMSYADLAWYSRIAFLRQAGLADDIGRLDGIARWLAAIHDRLSSAPDRRTVIRHDVA